MGLPFARHRHRLRAIDDRDPVRAFVDPHLVPARPEVYHPRAGVPHRRQALDLARNAPGAGREAGVHHRCNRDEHRARLVGERCGVEALAELLFDEGGGKSPFGEARTAEHGVEEASVVGDAADLVAIQRILHGGDRRRPIGAVGDELRDHGIVEHRDLGALVHARIDAAGLARRGLAIAREAPYGGDEAPRRVFGVDAAFQRPAVSPDILLTEGQGLASGDSDLLLHQVDAGDHLGDWMLNLEPRVHFQEIEVPLLVGDEFHRTGGAIADSGGQRAGLRPHCRPRFFVKQGARRLLDHLLVAALDRAFALAEVDDRASVIGEHLDFDMARVLDEALDEDPPVAEGRRRLVDGGRHASLSAASSQTSRMPLPPPPAEALIMTG